MNSLRYPVSSPNAMFSMDDLFDADLLSRLKYQPIGSKFSNSFTFQKKIIFMMISKVIIVV